MALGAMRLGRILDHGQTKFTGDVQDGVHVGEAAEEVDKHDGAGAAGDCGGDPA